LASFTAAFQVLVAVGEDLAWFVALAGSVALLVMAAGLRTRAPIPHGEIQRVPLGLLTLGFGLFGSFAQVLTLSISVLPGIWVQVGTLGICSVTLASILAWAVPSTSAPWRLRVFLALGGAAVVGLALAPLFFTVNSVYGLFGVMRTAGAACLAIAVVKHDLLGVPLPRLAVKRGLGATAALAALFIVAQVAQNFFAAQYGLLMGGVVAGAVVFAASPIQRAMERATDKSAARRETTPLPRTSDAGKESAYRVALGVALRDKRLTREETLGLAQLADELGLSHMRAKEIWLDVEAETGRRRRPE
jgi:hypothetical protein